jgi:AGZA family xanthine/uracil permease-like MFS transporter
MGLFPALAAWGAMMAKNGLRAAGMGTEERPFTEALVQAFRGSDTWIHGALALEQGFIFSAMILAAATVAVIERKFIQASLWCLSGAALSTVGLMHSYRWTTGDTAIALSPAWPWAAGYGIMAAVFLSARWLTVEGEAH